MFRIGQDFQEKSMPKDRPDPVFPIRGNPLDQCSPRPLESAPSLWNSQDRDRGTTGFLILTILPHPENPRPILPTNHASYQRY